MRPQTVRALSRAYQLSDGYKRLKQQSQIHYMRLLEPLSEIDPDCAIDELTCDRITEIADSFAHRSRRRPFFKLVTLLYNWARRNGFSALDAGPVDHLIVRAPRKEWVYFIGSGPGDPIKIGRACHLGNRLSILQTGNPLVLKVHAAFETMNAAADEGALLRRFSPHQIRGEWFYPHPDLWAEIERITADGHMPTNLQKQHYKPWKQAA
jgi:hypothetical protein